METFLVVLWWGLCVFAAALVITSCGWAAGYFSSGRYNEAIMQRKDGQPIPSEERWKCASENFLRCGAIGALVSVALAVILFVGMGIVIGYAHFHPPIWP